METTQIEEILQILGVLISKLPSEETAETRGESHRGDRRDLSLEKGQQPCDPPRQEGGEERKWGSAQMKLVFFSRALAP